jgi:hypothetical protein
MRRALIALVCLLLLGAPVLAAEQTCIVVKVADQSGSGIANVAVTRDSAPAKRTDGSGVTFWCLAVSSTSCELRVDGAIVSASTGTKNATATLRDNVVYVAWLRGTDPVNVTITARATGTTPTPTATRTTTPTPYPTITPGPSPTQAATHTPDDSIPYVLIEAAPMVQPGRFTYTWWPNMVDVEVFTADGDSMSHDGPTWYSVEASGWVRFYVVPDPDLYPPSVVTRVVTATPDAATRTATPTAAQPAATLTATLPPDAAPDCEPTPSSLEEGAARFKAWARDNYGVDPYVLYLLGE